MGIHDRVFKPLTSVFHQKSKFFFQKKKKKMTNIFLVLLFAIGCHAFRYAPYDQQGRYTRPGYRRPLGEVPNIFKPNNDKEFSNFFNSDSKSYGLGNHVNYGQTQSYGHSSGYGGYSQQKKNPTHTISNNFNQLNHFEFNKFKFNRYTHQKNLDNFKNFNFDV